MKEQEIINKLQEIFVDIFGEDIPKLNNSTNAGDISEWDSLNHISILAAIQDDFSITFDIDEIIEMKNVGDMVNAIKEKI